MANCSSRLRLRLRCAKVSVADPKIAMCRHPSSSARSRPALVRHQHRQLPAVVAQQLHQLTASASWGTHFGCTKLVASTIGSPAATSRRMNSAFTSVGTSADSFCSPSRGPTS